MPIMRKLPENPGTRHDPTVVRIETRAVETDHAGRTGSLVTRRKQRDPLDWESVQARQARRLASAKRAILKEFGSLEKPEDFERLQRERKIFAVSHENATYVPSFQFDEKGNPRPAVAKVIEILGKDTSDWGLAIWFTAGNGWLDDRRPVDLLKDDPEQVVQAAEHEAAELVF